MAHWSWEHFVTDGSLFKTNQSKRNAWCKQCLAHEAELIRSADVVAARARTAEEAEAQARINCRPMAGKPKQNMVPHLSKCRYVDPSVRAFAQAAKALAITEQSQAAVPQSLSQSASSSHPLRPQPVLPTVFPPGPSFSALSPLPSPFPLSAPLFAEPQSKRKRTSSASEDTILSHSAPWTPALQSQFGEDLCRLLVAVRAPWSVASNPQMRLFVQKWVPGAVVPDEQTLSGPILDREAAKVEHKLKTKLSGRLATFMIDGWKNKAKQSLVASMVSVASEPYLMRTHDVSADAKSGDALLKLVTDDLQWIENTYKVSVIGVCTDNGGDARKMRRLLLILMPWLITLICWAHQINLVVGDYMSLQTDDLTCFPKASSLIKWMNNHSHALNIFRREQLQTYNKISALILPVTSTRWTAHYLSLRRLLDIEIPMRTCWMKYSQEMIECAGPKADVQQKAREIHAIVEDLQFWTQVKRTCGHLRPLAIATHITQASTTRLDHVLTTLGNLYRIYSDTQVEDAVRTRVLASLEKRWAAADQEPFIAAVILNPFLRGQCFSRANVVLTPSGLCNMLKRLHLRVFRSSVDPEFRSAFMDYYNDRAEFSNAFLSLGEWEEIAKRRSREVKPVDVWEGIDTQERVGRNCLVKLAVHILNIVANSAGCERAFGRTEPVQTVTGSKLSVDKVHKTTIVGTDIKRSHIEAGLVHTREFNMPETDGDMDDGYGGDPLDFSQLAEQLIEDASEDVNDSESDTNEPPDVPLTTLLPLHDTHFTLQETSLPARSATTKIPLKSLFIFSKDPSTPSIVEYFWKGGIQNLDKEMEVHETLCSSHSQESGVMDTSNVKPAAG